MSVTVLYAVQYDVIVNRVALLEVYSIVNTE